MTEQPIQKKIAVVPLDDRPCCRQFPSRIGGIAGFRIVQPPKELLGRFTTPGQCERIAQWMSAIAGDVDGIVVAIDQLAFGGLVASRTNGRPLEKCLDTLKILAQIKERHPALPIYANNILMRITITSKNKAYASYSKHVFRYSQLHDRVHRLGEAELLDELEQVRQQIPAHVLEEYLEARKRNHAVNLAMIDLCAQGVLDYLTITQEDASPIGMHLTEQQLLVERIYRHRAYDKVMVYPGADEGTQTLLARMMQRFAGRQIRIFPRYSSTTGRTMIADFEDRPVEETVRSHIVSAGAVCVEHAGDADITLFVNTPVPDVKLRPGPQKHAFSSRHPLWDMVAGIKHELASGRRVAIADVAICNASDLELLRYILDERLYLRLDGYAGWNTAGNTLGTVISHSIAGLLGRNAERPAHDRERAHIAFMLERLMDEWAYQAQVRGDVNAWIEANLNVSPNDLEQHYDVVNARVEAGLRDKFAELVAGVLASHCMNVSNRVQLNRIALKHAALPWNRTFEVEVEVACELRSV